MERELRKIVESEDIVDLYISEKMDGRNEETKSLSSKSANLSDSGESGKFESKWTKNILLHSKKLEILDPVSPKALVQEYEFN